MKRIIVSSLFRLVEYPEKGEVGRVYVLDWETKELMTNPVGIEPGYSLHKPTGKSHGARGVTIYNDKILVAGSGNKFSYFDRDTYELIETFELNYVSYTHQIKSVGEFLYIVSTGNDKIFKICGKEIVEEVDLVNIRDTIDPHLTEGRLKHEWGSDRAHVNSVGWDSEGNSYHVYLGANMLLNYTTKEVIYQGGLFNAPHDILEHGGDLIVNSTLEGTTIKIDKDTHEASVIFCSMTEDNPGGINNDWGATRALCTFGDYLFIGSVPTRITMLKRVQDGTYEFIETFDISLVQYEAIYDMVLDPRDW